MLLKSSQSLLNIGQNTSIAPSCSYTEADHHRTGIELALEASMPTSSSSSSSDDSHGLYGVDLETLAVSSLLLAAS